MQYTKQYLTILPLLFGASVILAQGGDDPLPGQTITVISEAKPILADADKVKLNPELPAIEATTPDLTYDVPDRKLALPFTPPDVKPLAMRADELPPLNNVYAKVGFGNYTTPYLDLFVNSGRGSGRDNNMNLAAQAHWLSSNGPLPDQRFSDLRTKLLGSFFTEQTVFHALGGFDRTGRRFYGYDAEVDTLIAAMDNRQHFNHIFGGMRFNNTQRTYSDIDYDGGLVVHYVNDRFKQSELNPVFDLSVSKKADNGHRYGGALLVDYSTYRNDSATRNLLILGLKPSYRIQGDIWFADLGINIGTDERGFFVFPNVRFERELLDKAIVFHALFTGDVVKNNFRRITDENPFVNYNIALNNSREWGVTGGLRGAPATGFSYNVQVNWRQVRYLPLYLPDSIAINRFNVVYDTTASVVNVHTELGYSFAEKFRVMGSVDYYNYTLKHQFAPWHLPTLKLSAGIKYRPMDKLETRADVSVFNKMQSRKPDGTVTELPGVADINIGAAYHITPSFHIFIDANNLMAANYQRWYNYPSLGLNVIGGLKMIF
jgi:hypothetical protein